VKNRTHWVEEGINLQWDGNKEGRDVCYFKSHAEIYLYKVSDKCFTAAELSNVTVVGSEREDAIELLNKPNDSSENMGFSCVMLGVSGINSSLNPAVISVGAPVNFEGAFVAPSAGTYLADMSDPVWFGYWKNEDGSPWAPVGYIKSVVGEETVHKLDKKFLPDGVGGAKTIIYAQSYEDYLYHDEDFTKKVSAAELDEMMNGNGVGVIVPGEYSRRVCYPVFYSFSDEWGSELGIMQSNIAKGFHTKEYISEG
jgi:hypothetical protein